MSARPPIVLVVGPTASGKTSLSLALAQAFHGEIVNADSVQIYRGFDIGSCKPSAAERARTRHHLVDALEPDDPCDAGRFVKLADAAIADIAGRGYLPLVVGGTGLYFRALVHGLAELPPVRDEIRAEVLQTLADEGVAACYARLQEVDPELAARTAPRDRQRITRALEVFRETGVPLSVHQARHGFREQRYPALTLALDWPREALYERIDRRVAELFEEGFPEEVEGLLARGLSPDLRPMGSLGYRELIEALQHPPIDREATIDAIRRGHRHYAKRQLTWFRKVEGVVWLPPAEAILTAWAEVERFLTAEG